VFGERGRSWESAWGNDLEACGQEVAVEGEDTAQAMPAHESKGSAVGETDFLISKSGEQVEGRQLVFRVRPQDCQRFRAE
jgi:hypothetical protein